MSTFSRVTALAVIFVAAATAALAAPIGGKHGRSEIKSTCGASGGSYYSNLDGYGCIKNNCDGKGNLCGVVCKNNGKCEGSTPPAAAAQSGVKPSTPGAFLSAK
ncbi:MAG: hypothetical protein WAT78_01320 [Rhizobiaceae bacterium]